MASGKILCLNLEALNMLEWRRFNSTGHDLTFLLVSPEARAPEGENTKSIHKSLAERSSSSGLTPSLITQIIFHKPSKVEACLHRWTFGIP